MIATAVNRTHDTTTCALPAPDKARYEWIDNARVIAALLIIYVHMPWFFHGEPHVNNDLARSLVRVTTYYGRIPFFLILAGYFLARRITWHKAIDRAVWLAIPFVAWNALYWGWLHRHTLSLGGLVSDFPDIIGLAPFFTRDMNLFAEYNGVPLIPVSWFLRDIIMLSLITPLLYRIRRMLLVVLILVFCVYPQSYMPSTSCVMLAPTYCLYYLLGVCLVDFRIADAYRILNSRFSVYVIIGVVLAVVICLYTSSHGLPWMEGLLPARVFGALMIAQGGVLIEKHLPRFSKWLAPCGPACFLVFMLHAPVFLIFSCLLPKWLTDSWLVWLLPVPVCAGIICLFLLMKRFTPWLMPYLGHMKVPKKV